MWYLLTLSSHVSIQIPHVVFQWLLKELTSFANHFCWPLVINAIFFLLKRDVSKPIPSFKIFILRNFSSLNHRRFCTQYRFIGISWLLKTRMIFINLFTFQEHHVVNTLVDAVAIIERSEWTLSRDNNKRTKSVTIMDFFKNTIAWVKRKIYCFERLEKAK